MRVVSCIATEHNLWLVALAVLVCACGAGVAFELLHRARDRAGRQRTGWIFMTAVAAGSTVWCTHFTAVLAYESKAALNFDPATMGASLLIAINGIGLGLHLAMSGWTKWAPALGGAVVGLAIAAMHYTDMMAVDINGLVVWDRATIVLSALAAAGLGAFALQQAVERPHAYATYSSTGLFVLATGALHFTGMSAISVVPLDAGLPVMDPGVQRAMAIVVAGVGLIVVGTGVASYLIDGYASLEAVERLQRMALNDALTGLPNRSSFRDRIASELETARSHEIKLGVIGIDLDRFKEINDIRGHEAGDEALRITSRRLVELLKDGEFVARIGGDEFAALKRFSDRDELQDFVARLEKSLFTPICLDDYEVVTGASIGVSVYPDDGEGAERLVNNADLAMYRAKDDVTTAVLFYEPKMDEAERAHRTLGQDLRRAIELQQLELYYQVQTSVTTGDITGYEALLRWHHPERGMVSPTEFIPVAEETGMIIAIGEWVLRTACKAAAAWHKPHKIAVNLSAVQFAHTDLARLVHEVLFETGLPAQRLELEITESTIIADKLRTLHTLRRIKALGVTVAIDDFGVGYSSLDTLRSFPFDKIKLDRSFMQEVEVSQQAKAIVRAVLTLAKSLDILVLAEGVETRTQLSLLASEECDEAQGFFIGRPAPVSHILEAQEAAVDHGWLMVADERHHDCEDQSESLICVA